MACTTTKALSHAKIFRPRTSSYSANSLFSCTSSLLNRLWTPTECEFLSFKRFLYKKKWAMGTQRTEQSSDVAIRCLEMEMLPIFGDNIWRSVRLAIQSPPKYAAVINDFSDLCAGTEDNLSSRSAANIFNTSNFVTSTSSPAADANTSNLIISKHLAQQFTFSSSDSSPEPDAAGVYARPLTEDDTEYVTDTRLVTRDYDPTSLSDDLLYNKVDEYGQQFATAKIVQVPDDDIPNLSNGMWPLRAYTFPWSSTKTFGTPERDSRNLQDFYPMDAASLLPVIALNVQPGDEVLDACAAPGGKSFCIIQQQRAALLHMNDGSFARMNRLRRMLASYLPPSVPPKQSLQDQLTSHTGNDITQIKSGMRLAYSSDDITQHKWNKDFDRVLLDVPCTTDRQSAVNNEENWYSTRRTAERRQLPDLQRRLLRQALRALRIGGVCVYSTCSMSPMQNDGVVYSALQEAAQVNIECKVLDMKPWMEQFNSTFKLYAIGGTDQPYGVTAFPHICSNFGPIYVCKLRRIK